MLRYYFPVLVTFCLWINFACEETESTLGGVPGGNPAGVWDSLVVSRMSIFQADHALLNARAQYIGYVDSLGLAAQFLFQLDYQPLQLMDPQPEEGTFKTSLSLKMDNVAENIILENRGAPPPGMSDESVFYMSLDLLMLDLDPLEWSEFDWNDKFFRHLLTKMTGSF